MEGDLVRAEVLYPQDGGVWLLDAQPRRLFHRESHQTRAAGAGRLPETWLGPGKLTGAPAPCRLPLCVSLPLRTGLPRFPCGADGHLSAPAPLPEASHRPGLACHAGPLGQALSGSGLRVGIPCLKGQSLCVCLAFFT